MTKIVFETFLGANSRVSPELLPNGYATEATNVFTDSGNLDVWHTPLDQGPNFNSKTTTLSSLFLMNNALLLAWAGARVDVALMQKASNLDWEIFFTGTDKPRYTNRLLAVSGGGHSYPEVSFPVGIPVPTWLLIATVGSKVTPANSVRVTYTVAGTAIEDKGNRIARTYVYTFVNDSGREGAPSEPSNTVYSNDDEQITLTHIPPVPQADIHKIRVYVAASGGTYNYLKEIALPATSNVITDNEFGDALETTLYSPPKDNMIGVTAMANGILAGYSGNDLCFSEPYQSHAWPEDYITAMDYPIKGLASYGNMLYISTEGYPLIATGNSPAYMSFTKLGAMQSCLSTASMVGTGGGAMYAARDGIVLIGSGEATLISEGLISKRLFNLLNPSSIHAYFYRGKYVGFYNTGGTGTITMPTGEAFPAKGAFVLDPERKVVTFLDIWYECGYVDNVSGRFYLVKKVSNVNRLYIFDAGTDNLDFIWKTKPILTPKTHFSVGKVRAERYPFTFQLYADNVLKHTQTVTSERAFRLPSGYMATEWAVRLSGDSTINSITLAESMSELK
jgi:hypothetical protein